MALDVIEDRVYSFVVVPSQTAQWACTDTSRSEMKQTSFDIACLVIIGYLLRARAALYENTLIDKGLVFLGHERSHVLSPLP